MSDELDKTIMDLTASLASNQNKIKKIFSKLSNGLTSLDLGQLLTQLDKVSESEQAVNVFVYIRSM